MTREVVLVCGPPCAGKSTYVADNAKPGDVVVDFDAIARGLGSTSYDHPPRIRADAQARRAVLEEQVARMQAGRAWVVRTAADPRGRQRLAGRLGATRVVVLDPGRHVAAGRAKAASRPHWTVAAIDRWYAEYRPSPVDYDAPSVARGRALYASRH